MKILKITGVNLTAMAVGLVVALSSTNSHATVEITTSPVGSVSGGISLSENIGIINGQHFSGADSGSAALGHLSSDNGGIYAGKVIGGSSTLTTATVPEPASMTKLAAGMSLGVFGFFMLRRKLKAA